MCRLFGMHTGAVTSAEFWLVEAPDSMSAQSRTNADGFGIGTFSSTGRPVVEKEPLPAWSDPAFARSAHQMRGTTFIGHVRHATTGALTPANTHPFEQEGRLFAHNGAFQELEQLDRRLAELDASGLVHGQTDSERFFALVTAETARADGRVADGITAAVAWISDRLPVVSLNLVLITAHHLWALRYPATDTLFLLERPAGGSGRPTAFDGRGSALSAHAAPLEDQPAVIVASERLDDDPLWREVGSGELIHVDEHLRVESRLAFPDAPAHQVQLAPHG